MGLLKIISAAKGAAGGAGSGAFDNIISVPASAFHAPATGGAVFTEVEGIPAFSFEAVTPSMVSLRIYNDGRITTDTFNIRLRLKSAADEATDNTSVWSIGARLIRIDDGSDIVLGPEANGSINLAVANDEKELLIEGVRAGGDVSADAALEVFIVRLSAIENEDDDYADDVYLLAATLEINK
jgi:hypothetical protein